MKKIKVQKGITLVALIITIIVLLILAVVAIGAVQNDGIIDYAKNSKEAYMTESEKENEILQNHLNYLNKNNPDSENSKEDSEIEDEEQEISSISIEDLELKQGEEGQLILSVEPNVNIEGVTYTSSDSTIATVDSTGKVNGVSVGTVTITATYKELSAACTVIVKTNVTSIEISGVPETMSSRDTFQLQVTTKPTNVTEGIEYISSNTNVAEISDTGYVTIVGVGTTTITVTYGEIFETVEISATGAVEGSTQGGEDEVPDVII